MKTEQMNEVSDIRHGIAEYMKLAGTTKLKDMPNLTFTNTDKNSTGISDLNTSERHYSANCQNSSRIKIPFNYQPDWKSERRLKELIKNRLKTQKEAEEKQTRISQLHNEQVRAWRKIDQIRKRAADLMKFKLNKEEKLERQLLILKNQEDMERQNRTKVQNIHKIRGKSQGKKNLIQLEKQRDACEIKMRKNDNLLAIRRCNEEANIINQERIQRIKESKKQASFKSELYKNYKNADFLLKSQYEFQHEKRLQNEKEQELANLDNFELKMINEVHHTHLIEQHIESEYTNLIKKPTARMSQALQELYRKKQERRINLRPQIIKSESTRNNNLNETTSDLEIDRKIIYKTSDNLSRTQKIEEINKNIIPKLNIGENLVIREKLGSNSPEVMEDSYSEYLRRKLSIKLKTEERMRNNYEYRRNNISTQPEESFWLQNAQTDSREYTILPSHIMNRGHTGFGFRPSRNPLPPTFAQFANSRNKSVLLYTRGTNSSHNNHYAPKDNPNVSFIY